MRPAHAFALGDRLNDSGVTMGLGVNVDVAKLVKGRLLINANSGGGKSYALRRILEQTNGVVPQHVIDPEGEFHTLREKFDVVLAGRPGGQKGDTAAHPKMAAHLAKRMLELGVSVVIDLFELDKNDRILFVKNYLDGLMDAPRALWRPTMVVVDEAPLFCPEKGEGEAVSTDAVINLMTRGRKRGFCGILATQRLSRLHKSAAAEVNNVLIGRTSLDNDLDRAAKTLGYSQHQRALLKKLPPGRFHAFGPAISDEVVIVQMGGIQTTHPEAGEAQPAPAPPRGKIAKVLAELANLADDAAEEAKTTDELKAKVAELELRLKRQIPSNMTSTAPGPRQLEQALAARAREAHGIGYAEGFAKATDNALALAQRTSDACMTALARPQVAISEAVKALCDGIRKGNERARAPKPATVAVPANGTPVVIPVRLNPDVAPEMTYCEITGPEQKILDALAWFEVVGVADPDLAPLAFIAGYSPHTSSFKEARGSLRAKAFVLYANEGRTTLTPDGRRRARPPNLPTTNEAFHEAIISRLPTPEAKVLRCLLPLGSEGLGLAQLAGETGYSPHTSSFKEARGRLRAFGFVEYGSGGTTFASMLMYPEGP